MFLTHRHNIQASIQISLQQFDNTQEFHKGSNKNCTTFVINSSLQHNPTTNKKKLLSLSENCIQPNMTETSQINNSKLR